MLTCLHLNELNRHVHHAWFSGHGAEFFRVCPECAAKYPHLPEELVEASLALSEVLNVFWRCEGICGSPEVMTRDSSLHFVHKEYLFPFSADIRVIDIVPDQENDEDWFCLTASGSLYRLSIHRTVATELCRISDLGFDIDDDTVLCCSARGDYGAIYPASGQFGIIFDLHTGMITYRMNRGDNDTEYSQYSVAFFQSDGRTLAIVPTDSNRLDIVDPTNGDILTARTPNPDRMVNSRPEHDLDYYHGQLLVSADSHWVIDNGWAWHPFGIIRSWNLQHWLNRNAWESEDGSSVREFALRDGYWDGPVCWIDSTTVAIWGWGSSWNWLIPAVRIFDVVSGQELRWFPGPETRPVPTDLPMKVRPSLFFDEYLYSVSDKSGTAVWDIATGERLVHEESFAPVQYHPRSREFLSVTTDGFRLSRISK